MAALFHTQDEAASWRANLDSTRNLIAVVQEHAPDVRLAMSSTGNVYNADATRPALGTDECSPTTAYGASKVAAEQLLRDSTAHRVSRLTPDRMGRSMRGADYKPWQACGHTKLAAILLARELQHLYQPSVSTSPAGTSAPWTSSLAAGRQPPRAHSPCSTPPPPPASPVTSTSAPPTCSRPADRQSSPDEGSSSCDAAREGSSRVASAAAVAASMGATTGQVHARKTAAGADPARRRQNPAADSADQHG